VGRGLGGSKSRWEGRRTGRSERELWGNQGVKIEIGAPRWRVGEVEREGKEEGWMDELAKGREGRGM